MKYLPDFCWQHMDEIVTMLEQVFLNINPGTVSKLVCDLRNDGEIITKLSPYKRVAAHGKVFMYMKNNESKQHGRQINKLV